jgi:hypothetical protein
MIPSFHCSIIPIAERSGAKFNLPKGDFLMHHIAIKAHIKKQLKIRCLKWHRLKKNEKKAVANKVLDDVEPVYPVAGSSVF